MFSSSFLCLNSELIRRKISYSDWTMPNAVVTHDANDYRVVVFGAAGVGKSSIVQQFVHGSYRESYTPTVEDTYRKVILVFHHCRFT